MAEQHFFNFAEDLGALHARLTLPEQDESLAADAALGLGVSLGAFTQNLHRMFLAFLPAYCRPQDDISEGQHHWIFPIRQAGRPFGAAAHPLFG
jgi:hypothetical protein